MPIINEQYVAPAWRNDQPPDIDEVELQAISDSIVKNQLSLTTKAPKAIPDDAAPAVKFTLGVENGKLYMMEV